MLNNIKLRNFKSWESLDIEFAPITGLFGKNSSGKSSILQFLLMLKQTKETTDRSLAVDLGNNTSYANLGSFKDVITGKNQEKKLSWEIKWKLLNDLQITDPSQSRKTILFQDNILSLKTPVSLIKNQIKTENISYFFSNQEFKLDKKLEKSHSYDLTTSGEKSSFKFIRTPGRVWELPEPIKSYLFPDQAKTYFQNTSFLSDFELEYENFIDRIFYLGPLREYPKREYIWAGSKPNDVGRRGEKIVDAILAARANNEKRNLGHRKPYKSFEEIIAIWLKKIGLIHNFEVEEIAKDSNYYKVSIQAKPFSEKVLITDVGFGVSQFLPVLVLLYYVPKGSIILLEQPEIHLHPAVQSGLADIIINAVETRNIQVIVESHSEHLLRRIQRRVAEEIIPPEKAKLYFCDIERGKSVLNNLDMDLFGNITNWPKDFFGDEFEEITAIQKAGLKRKINSKK